MKSEHVYLQSDSTIIKQANKCRDLFYDSIGQEFNKNARTWKHIVPRHALAVAIARNAGDHVAGESLGKDRTTILHARKRHAQNMKYWTAYPLYFKKAQDIVRICLEETEREARLEVVEKMIQNLEAEKKYIKSLI